MTTPAPDPLAKVVAVTDALVDFAQEHGKAAHERIDRLAEELILLREEVRERSAPARHEVSDEVHEAVRAVEQKIADYRSWLASKIEPKHAAPAAGPGPGRVAPLPGGFTPPPGVAFPGGVVSA